MFYYVLLVFYCVLITVLAFETFFVSSVLLYCSLPCSATKWPVGHKKHAPPEARWPQQAPSLHLSGCEACGFSGILMVLMCCPVVCLSWLCGLAGLCRLPIGVPQCQVLLSLSRRTNLSAKFIARSSLSCGIPSCPTHQGQSLLFGKLFLLANMIRIPFSLTAPPLQTQDAQGFCTREERRQNSKAGRDAYCHMLVPFAQISVDCQGRS